MLRGLCVLEQTSERLVHCGYRKFPTDLSALLLGDLYYTRLSVSGVSADLSHNALLELYQILNANLSSNISKVCLKSRDSERFNDKFYKISEEEYDHVYIFTTNELFPLSGPPADTEDSLSV